MQITLKVKSVQSLNASSPTITFLSGSLLWIAMHTNGSVIEQSAETATTCNIKVTTSIWHISQHDKSQIDGLSIACVRMCIAEVNSRLDPVEF